MKKKQSGFTIVEVLIALIIIGVIGFAGWFVWQHKSKDTNSDSVSLTEITTDKQDKVTSKALEESAITPTGKLKTYSSEKGKFSLQYPSDWVTASNIEYCEGEILLLGTTIDNSGKCQSDAPVLVVIARSSSSPEEWLDFSKAGNSGSYTNVTKKEVTVDGVKGTKLEGTYTGSGEELGPLPSAKVVTYYFMKDGYTYYAKYTQGPTDPDVLDKFNQIVTATLKFN